MKTNPKKIAILCNYQLLPERVGGMDYFFWLFDARCRASHIEVDWFFPNLSAHGNYPQLHIISSEGEEVEAFFGQHHASQDYSHVITHFIELCTPFFRSVKRKTQAKIIGVDHNPRPLAGYPLKKRIEKKVKGILYSRYIDVFVAVSDYSKTQLLREFGMQIKKKVQVVFNGIAIEKYLKKTDFTFAGKFIVACHLRKDKGVQDLVMAVRELQKASPVAFTIDIYGKGDYQAPLQQMIDFYGLGATFSFKGSVSGLHGLYSQYDYLIHPSHGETFCYSVVEGLMSNLPVITTKNQGNVLGLVTENENGFLFEEKNVAQLTEILHDILTQKKAINGWYENPKLAQLTLSAMVENHFNLIR